MQIAVSIEGRGRLKPSVNFKPTAQPMSSRPATKRTTHAMTSSAGSHDRAVPAEAAMTRGRPRTDRLKMVSRSPGSMLPRAWLSCREGTLDVIGLGGDQPLAVEAVIGEVVDEDEVVDAHAQLDE